MQDHKGLVGTWRLISFQVRGPGDAIRYPFGPDATGLLIYTANGLMAGQIMRRGRATFASATITGGTSDELAEAATGYIAYAGTYSVDEAAAVVTHHVTMSLFPNLVGTDQRRGMALDGDRLDLSAGAMVISWERVR
jgi:hypothetical protein